MSRVLLELIARCQSSKLSTTTSLHQNHHSTVRCQVTALDSVQREVDVDVGVVLGVDIIQ